MDKGATEMLLRLLLVLQVYVLAPEAVKLILWPEHNALVPVMLTTGKLYTVTACVAPVDPTHPAALVPLNEYVILDVGATAILPKLLLVLQVYVVAPFAVSVMVCPVHKALVPVILTTGKVFTVTANDAAAALKQPAVLRPINVYVVLDVGATDILLKLLLVLQVYVLAPDAVKLIL